MHEFFCKCFYRSSRLESSKNFTAPSAANAARVAKQYYTTLVLVIERIEVYNNRTDTQPVYTLKNTA